MTRDDIAAVMKKVPLLNDFGIGLFEQGRGLSKEEQDARLQKGREQLLDSAESCTRICGWLSSRGKIKTINKRHSSYGLKHMAEKEIGYVTNGAFITAAIHCGFPYELIPGDPNVFFGISEKSLVQNVS